MSNVVKKKKRWGKVYQWTPIVRSAGLDEEKAKDIEKELTKGKGPFTPQALAQKYSIKVSLAKKILKDFVDNDKLQVVYESSKHKIYGK